MFATSRTPTNPEAWIGAPPVVKVSVASEGSNTFRVNATVRDLRNGNLLSEPSLLVKAGAPTRVELGTTGDPASVLVAFSVTVAANGEFASYVSDIRTNNEVLASEEALLVVSR